MHSLFMCTVQVMVVGALTNNFPLFPGPRNIPQSRVIGGEAADLGEFPSYVLLFYEDAFMCGGSLINRNTVLTAYHCVFYDVR